MEMELLSGIAPEGADFILKDFIPLPRCAVSLLSAQGGIGKTRLALIMASRHIQRTGEKVALWLTEDYKGQIRHIYDEMVIHDLAESESMSRMWIILESPPQLARRENGIFKANYEEIKKIGMDLVLKDVKFAVFDPLLAFYGGNENDNSEARVFIQSFAEWAKISEVTTLIIHHATKDGGSRGASAFHDGVRARYEMNFIRGSDGVVDIEMFEQGVRECVIKKDNWGARKHLWRLTGGADKFGVKIAPEMSRPLERSDELKIVKSSCATIEVEEIVYEG